MHTRYSAEEVESIDYVSPAIPIMFSMILLEILVGKLQRKKIYRSNDAINSLSMGVFERMVELVFTKGFEVYTYIWVYNNYALVDVRPDSLWLWIVTFLGVDLAYYWFHRMAHEINAFWASHITHHSSEEYNLTTALRQSASQALFSWVFYLPLALFVPPPLQFMHRQFNLLYQFWIHTRTVGKMGPLEYILNTPSHHRVHHGRNRAYIDKNYAGVLIIWDRMFGTFEEEKHEVTYGITKPLNTWSVLAGQFHHYSDIVQRLQSTTGLQNKLKVVFYGPGWYPGKPRMGDINDIAEPSPNEPKYNPALPTVLNLYVLTHFTLAIGASFLLLTFQSSLIWIFQLLIAIFVIFSLNAFGALMDRKPYAFAVELARIFIFLGAELFFWQLYKDEFIFLWYKDPMRTMIGWEIPLKCLRAVFVFSALWLIGRVSIYPFYGGQDNDTLKKAKAQ